MRKQVFITEEERTKCQKVADAFAELYEDEDVLVMDAGNYGFLKLQYFKIPFVFEDAITFADSKSLFNDLWTEWLNTQLIHLSRGTPMEDMDYSDILKCMPKEKQKELLDKRTYFAEKTGIEGISERSDLRVQDDRLMEVKKYGGRDWKHFDWLQVRDKICNLEEIQRHEEKAIKEWDIGITLDGVKEYFQWLYDMRPERYLRVVFYMALIQAEVTREEVRMWEKCSEELRKTINDLL